MPLKMPDIAYIVVVVGILTYGMGVDLIAVVMTVIPKTVSVILNVLNVFRSFLSAAADLAVMISSIVAIASEAFVELVISATKLFTNVLKFFFIVLHGTANILWELLPVGRFVLQSLATILWIVLAPIKYIILLPWNFSSEIGHFFLIVYNDFCEGLVYCKNSMYDLYINHKDLILQTFYDILSKLVDFFISIQTFLTKSYEFTVSTFYNGYIHFIEVFRMFIEKVVTMPSTLRQDLSILLLSICGALTLVLISTEFYKRRRRVVLPPQVELIPAEPVNHEANIGEDSSDESEYNLFEGESSLPDDAASLQRLLEAERDQRLCVVCQDRHKSQLLLPCRHLCLCLLCVREICSNRHVGPRECPLCRRQIDNYMAVFT